MDKSELSLLSTMMRLKLFGNTHSWPAFGDGSAVYYQNGWLVRYLKEKQGGRLVATRIY